MSIIVSAPRATAADPLDADKTFGSYMFTLDTLSVRANVFRYFFDAMPASVKEKVRVFDTEWEKKARSKDMVALEIKTPKGHLYSFTKCAHHALWFLDSQQRYGDADPAFIFTDVSFRDMFTGLSNFYLKVDGELVHITDSEYTGLVCQKALDEGQSSDLSCFSNVDIVNEIGTCFFNSFLYALLSDDDIRQKFKRASDRIVAGKTRAAVAESILEAIRYFEHPKLFTGKCFEDNFLQKLHERSPARDPKKSFKYFSQHALILRQLEREFEYYLPICNYSDSFNVHDAEVVYMTGLTTVKKIDLEITHNLLTYELFGLICDGPEHAMALSRCAFDPSLWQFHDAEQSKHPRRYFMFRGTNLSFFGSDADYEIGYSFSIVRPLTAFYKKKAAPTSFQREPSDLDVSCEHEFARIMDQKINRCENSFMQTLFGNAGLRSVIQGALEPLHTDSILQNMTVVAARWFEHNDRDTCPFNIEKAVRKLHLARFKAYKHMPDDILVPYAFKRHYTNFLLDALQKDQSLAAYIPTGKAAEMLWEDLMHEKDVVSYLHKGAPSDPDGVGEILIKLYSHEYQIKKIILAILLGVDPYAKYEKGRSAVSMAIFFKLTRFYQTIFNVFQVLQPDVVRQKLALHYSLPSDSNSALFCDRYDTLLNTDDEFQLDISVKGSIIGPVLETRQPEKYAALYTLIDANFSKIYGYYAANYLRFFQSESLDKNRGIMLATSKLKRIQPNLQKKARDFNTECDQVSGLLLFEDVSATDLFVDFLAGSDAEKTEMLEILIRHAQHKKYNVIRTWSYITKNSEDVFKSLHFEFDILDEHSSRAYLLL